MEQQEGNTRNDDSSSGESFIDIAADRELEEDTTQGADTDGADADDADADDERRRHPNANNTPRAVGVAAATARQRAFAIRQVRQGQRASAAAQPNGTPAQPQFRITLNNESRSIRVGPNNNIVVNSTNNGNGTNTVRIEGLGGIGLVGQPGQQQQQQRPHHHRIHIRQLEPQPLPTSQQDMQEDSQEGIEDRFTCGICFRVLKEPSSCGTCSSRFCRRCLNHVIQHHATGQQNIRRARAGNEPAKCPACRTAITQDELQLDRELAAEIDRATQVPCPYRGCQAVLRVSELDRHEQQCGFVKVSCRYVNFGCSWKGRRSDLAAHERACALFKVSGLVLKFRRQEAVHQHQLQMINGRIQQLAVLEAQLRENQQNNRGQLTTVRQSNPFHMVSALYTLICTPSTFFQDKDRYVTMVQARSASSQVGNFVMLVPTAILVTRVAMESVRLLTSFTGNDDTEAMLQDIEMILMGTACCMTGFLLWSCLVLDKAASQWSNFQAPRRRLGITYKPFQASAAVAALLLYSLAYYQEGRDTAEWVSRLKLLVNWNINNVLPPIVVGYLNKVAGRPTESTDVTLFNLRVRSIVHFGVRTVLLVSLFGKVAALDSICWLRVLYSNPNLANNDNGRFGVSNLFKTFHDDEQVIGTLLPMPIAMSNLVAVAAFKTWEALTAEQSGEAHAFENSFLPLATVGALLVVMIMRIFDVFAVRPLVKAFVSRAQEQNIMTTRRTGDYDIPGVVLFAVSVGALIFLGIA